MRRWWLWIVLLLSVGLNLGLFASLVIQRLRPPMPRVERGGMLAVRAGVERFADRLELEGEARRSFLERHRRFFESSREPFARLRRQRAELRQELTAAEPDRARAEQLIDEASTTYAELERELAGLVLDVRGLLSAGQQQQYLRFLERLRGFAGQGPAAGRPPLGERRRLRRPVIHSPDAR